LVAAQRHPGLERGEGLADAKIARPESIRTIVGGNGLHPVRGRA
jgi:hypothetical protein